MSCDVLTVHAERPPPGCHDQRSSSQVSASVRRKCLKSDNLTRKSNERWREQAIKNKANVLANGRRDTDAKDETTTARKTTLRQFDRYVYTTNDHNSNGKKLTDSKVSHSCFSHESSPCFLTTLVLANSVSRVDSRDPSLISLMVSVDVKHQVYILARGIK